MFLISVAIVCSRKAKSQIPSFKICEELSAEQMPEYEQILDNKTRLFMSKKQTVRQRFFSNWVRLFVFLLSAITSRH